MTDPTGLQSVFLNRISDNFEQVWEPLNRVLLKVLLAESVDPSVVLGTAASASPENIQKCKSWDLIRI